jgi:hypothetical protein
MEQYVHLLIPSDPRFGPAFGQVAGFFEMLVALWNYEIDWEDPYIPGIRIVWTTSEPKVETDPKSGKQFTMMPRFQTVAVSQTGEIAPTLEKNPGALTGRSGCAVAAQGKWRERELPVRIPRSLWPAEESEYACNVSCRLHPEPVCTSDWWGEDGDDPSQSQFGKPSDATPSTGRFTSPKSRQTVALPNAGSARFWIEVGFGDWIVPHLPDDFDLLDPMLIRTAEDHFGLKLAQAGRGVG